jgi:NAD(P)-dependent dehydrogenase (short-subunit alcohol dehydrogenase family)
MAMASSAAYIAAKHAVPGITKAAALEARSHGIRVNAVSPGFLLTKLVETAVNDHVGGEMWNKFVARQGRMATFEEVGDVVVLLSSPRMSLVTGQNLFIDG